VRNNPPDCSAATPTPNHRLTNINITGITDPDGDTVTIQITTISQDEPTKSTPGDPSPDGGGIGTDCSDKS
jgi:hypothetical protein